MIWFTSDTHYGHEKLISGPKGLGLRAICWPSVEEMDRVLLEECNSRVRPKDTLYHLGDFAFKQQARYRSLIQCKDVRFIRGNHDSAKTWNLFKYNWDVKGIKLQGDEPVHVWLSHYPHTIWPKSHYGSLHLYGHLHSQKEEEFDRIWPERRSMDVGVDNCYRLFGAPRPISETEVLEILLSRKGHDPIEFYKSTGQE